MLEKSYNLCSNLNIIFHIPWKIITAHPSGSQIRPVKMLEAFRALGCEVDVVMGAGEERCKQIKQIKQKIKEGKKYDFVYSESSTYPTILACGVKDALKSPLIDFRFFAFCKKNSIPIGLFYRDIYWRFPELLDKSLVKKWVLNIMYQFDLYVYQKYIDVLYLPSEKMSKYLGLDFLAIRSLPPGIFENCSVGSKEVNQGFNNILYVGGTNSHYGIQKLLKVVGGIPEISLTVCCREKDWQDNSNLYADMLKQNINVVHLSGDHLSPLYEVADVASLFMENTVYRSFAMPVKLFEYMSYKKPIIATEGTAAGDFVEANDVGWVIPYDEKALKKLLYELRNNPEILIEKKNQISKILPMNTWKSRALQVCKDLSP